MAEDLVRRIKQADLSEVGEVELAYAGKSNVYIDVSSRGQWILSGEGAELNSPSHPMAGVA